MESEPRNLPLRPTDLLGNHEMSTESSSRFDEEGVVALNASAVIPEPPELISMFSNYFPRWVLS